MLALGLTTAEYEALLATLRDSHRIRIGVNVLDRNEKVIRALEAPASKIIAGAVTVDARADVTRSLDLTLLDENRALGFDSGLAGDDRPLRRQLRRRRRGVFVPGARPLDRRPGLLGIVTDFERDRATSSSVEGMGKEALGLDPHFVTQGYTIRKGRRVDDAIRDVMDRLGETRYSLPDVAARLPRARAVEPEDEAWNVVKFGCESHEIRRTRKRPGERRKKKRVTVEYAGLVALAGHFTVYYDGLGRLTLAGARRTRSSRSSKGATSPSVPSRPTTSSRRSITSSSPARRSRSGRNRTGGKSSGARRRRSRPSIRSRRARSPGTGSSAT